VIFCGVNPASSAAAAGYNFSNGCNRFWRVLHLGGFTETGLQHHEERRLLEYGCGITAVIRRPTRSELEVSSEEFRQARRGFEAKIRRCAPLSIASLGKRAFWVMTGRPEVSWGRQSLNFAATMSRIGFTLAPLVTAYSELRLAVETRRGVRTTSRPRHVS
jgi:TDG/mug DNA glycosylase family protein